MENGEPWQPKNYHRICSLHFQGGDYSYDSSDENYIPTLFASEVEVPEFHVAPIATTEVILRSL